MKLGKTYQGAQSACSFSSALQENASCFPVFIPCYENLDAQKVSNNLLVAMYWRRVAYQSQKVISPIFLTGLHQQGIFKNLQQKMDIPLVAKLQRLNIREKKFLKKSLSLLSQIFYIPQLQQKSFSLTDTQVQKLLKILEHNQLFVQSDELVWWDISTQMIVAPDQIERREEKQMQLEVKCFVETKNDVFPLVVSDPMLLFSDVGIVVHNNDKRYKKHIGKKIIIPVINKSIPIFGVSDIDTVKDNGIQRLNPLLSHECLDKVKEYNLPLDEDFIDNKGFFSEKVAYFGGKSVFDFTSNIIDTLDTIGNLISQQEITQKIPYSKETGQRLIKRILPTLILDARSYTSDFFDWVNQVYPELSDRITTHRNGRLLLENKNPYSEGLVLLDNHDGELKVFQLMDYKAHILSPFAALLLYLLAKGYLKGEFSLEDVIDVIFLLPEKIWSNLIDTYSAYSKDEFMELKNKLKKLNAEELIVFLQQAIEEISWIHAKNTQIFHFHTDSLWGDGELYNIACNEVFSQVLGLLSQEKLLSLHEEQYKDDFLQLLLFVLFITDQKDKVRFSSVGTCVPKVILPDKFTKYIEKYGLEALRVVLIQQEKCDEITLQNALDYLKHVWNFFKVLYENNAFPTQFPDQMHVAGKEFWLLSQWWEIEQSFAELDFGTEAFAKEFQRLQKFTREQFSWYLALIKQEQQQESFIVAGQVFLGVVRIIGTLIPEFQSLFIATFGKESPFYLSREAFSGVKDYKIHLFFDILQGISTKKSDLQIKKHLPIHLTIQANTDILRMLKNYEPSLQSLFKTEKICYLTANEAFPSGFETFSILDITIGIKAAPLTQAQDSVTELEREYHHTSQALEYLRSTLMALSLNPLADPVLLSEKEEELESLKANLQKLEIQLQKLKMLQKK